MYFGPLWSSQVGFTVGVTAAWGIRSGGEAIVAYCDKGKIYSKIECQNVVGKSPAGNFQVKGAGTERMQITTKEGSVLVVRPAAYWFIDAWLTMKIPWDGQGQGICGKMGPNLAADKAYIKPTGCTTYATEHVGAKWKANKGMPFKHPCSMSHLKASEKYFTGCIATHIGKMKWRSKQAKKKATGSGFKEIAAVIARKGSGPEQGPVEFAKAKCAHLTAAFARENCIEDLKLVGNEPEMVEGFIQSAENSVVEEANSDALAAKMAAEMGLEPEPTVGSIEYVDEPADKNVDGAGQKTKAGPTMKQKKGLKTKNTNEENHAKEYSKAFVDAMSSLLRGSKKPD